jgi:rod shape-determining protein MreC
MKWISSLFSRYWRNLHFVGVLFLTTVLIVGQVGYNSMISEVFLAAFYYPFAKARAFVVELIKVNEENQRLRQALVESSIQIYGIEEIKRENSRLRAILGFEPPAGYRLLPAKVVATIGEKIPISATINRGKVDSVYINQTVINQQGLVGRVIAVGDFTATVQLLTDPANRCAARVSDTREMGIVKYLPSDGLMLDNFPVEGSIKEGDVIISSGLGGVYPAGLVVGVVSEAERPNDRPFYDVIITPMANFNSLEEVFLLRPDTR